MQEEQFLPVWPETLPNELYREDYEEVKGAQDADASKEEAEALGRRSGEVVIVPLPARSPLLGWRVSLPVMNLYKPSFASREDSVWITGVVGFYGEGGSWGAGAFHRMSIGGDQWRLQGTINTAELNYDYFGIGGEPDIAVPIRQDMSLGMVEALRRVSGDWFLGLRGVVSANDITPNLPPEALTPAAEQPELNSSTDLVALSPRVLFDSRDNTFYPREGILFEGLVTIGRESLGSDVDYERYQSSYNQYLTVGPQSVLALRTTFSYTAGNAPFFLFPAFGQRADLRGYETGSYRDRFLFATQAEYRWRFADRWGLVGFAGVGTVAPDFGGWDETLPAAGVGLRWVVAPRNNMSVRFDIARGRDNYEFYVGVGEAF